MPDEPYNVVIASLSWPVDKWQGFEEWQHKVKHLLETARIMGLEQGRASMKIEYQREAN